MERKHIERKLRRMNGMSPEARDAMHKSNAMAPWRCRCIHCGHWTVASRDKILKIDCVNCGLPLGHRV